MIFKAGTIKRIHVDKRIISQNLKHGTNLPPITVQTSKGSHKCYRADIKGISSFVYSPKKPLGCGARLWVETRSEVTTEAVGALGPVVPSMRGKCELVREANPMDFIYLT